MTERAPKLTLTYYKFSASADTLRLAAAIGKVPFTNRAIEKREWKPPPGKQGDPRYKLPVLEIEEKGKEKQVISQRNAILKYLGRRGGLYPTDPLEGLQVEYMLDTVSEALRPIEVSASGAVSSLLSSAPWTDEELLRIRERIATDSDVGLPRYLSFFERALHENGENNGSKWLVGTKVSIADLKLYQLVCWISGGTGDGDGPSLLKGIEASLVGKYTLLLKHKMQIESLPEVLSWRAKYLPPYSVFEYRPPFEFRRNNASTSVGSGSPRGNYSSTTFPRLTLSYFDSSARAEPIRLAAAIGNVPFTNRVISKEDWTESAKRYSPLGRLPTLLVVQPGKDLINAPQSTAILRWIGKLGGLYPPGEVDVAQVEFMIETVAEASRLVEMTVNGVVKKLILDVLKKEEIAEIRKRVLKNEICGLPLFLKYFESVIAANKGPGWLVGPNLTVADLALYHLSSWVGGRLDGGILGGDGCILNTTLLEKYPLIKQHREAIDNLRSVKRFREQHKPAYSTFDFLPSENDPVSGKKNTPDNLPKGARRRPSSDHFLPKNATRSKTFDGVLNKHPGFSAPSAPKRRSSTEEENVNGRPPEQQEKKTDKMMSAPLRRKPSFDAEEEEEPEPPRRKSRGVSLPPRPRPAPLIIADDEDEDLNFSDDSDSSSDGMNESNQSYSHPNRKARRNRWDDSSTDSADDDSSVSSIEHDLEGLKTRLKTALEKEKDLSSSERASSRRRRKDKKKKKKRSSKKEKKKKKSTRPAPDTNWENFTPKLPANTPRNAPLKKKSSKVETKATKTEVGGEPDEAHAHGVSKSKEASAIEHSSKHKKSEKQITPKSPRKTKRPSSVHSPKGIKSPKGSTRASIKVDVLEG